MRSASILLCASLGLLLGPAACDPGPASADHDATAPVGGKADGEGEAIESEPLPLDSREYKVLLDPAMFASDPDAAVDALWAEIEELAGDPDQRTEDAFDEIRERAVTLLDVPGSCDLAAAGLILRHRVEGDEAELTLKHRSADRFVAGQLPLGAAALADAKFEEDIVPPFASKYSRSVELEVDALDVAELDAPLEDFTGLQHFGLGAASPGLAPVGGVTVHERVYKGARVRLAGHKAKFTVTLWYLDAIEGPPEVAEVSFSYDLDPETGLSPHTARSAMTLFDRLGRLQGWVSAEPITKTRFLYELDPQFCG